MAWSVLQSVVAQSTTAVTTQAATYTSNCSSGSKLIAVAVAAGMTANQTVSSIKDGAGNSFVQQTHVQNNANGGPLCDVWALDTPAGDVGIKPTITATYSASGTGAGIWIGEVSGLLAGTSGIIDGTAGTSNGGNGTFATVGPPTYSSSASNEFLLYVYMDDGVPTTFTAPSGYTLDSQNFNNNSTDNIGVCYKNSTNGTETGSFSLSPSTFSNADGWILTMFALKLAPVVSPPLTTLYQFRLT